MAAPSASHVDLPRRAAPALRFAVVGAEGVRYAAVPTLSFDLRIDAIGAESIRSVLLDAQIQIAARRRRYAEAEQDRLLELFGTPERWGTTLRTLPWTRATVVVPPFSSTVTVPVTVPVTYDLEVTAARYFAALADGEVPLDFMFSGTIFYTGERGTLQTARIAWDADVDFALPVSVWRATMERHFADTGWLRLGTETLARLSAYRARHAFTSWDATLDALLGGGAGP